MQTYTYTRVYMHMCIHIVRTQTHTYDTALQQYCTHRNLIRVMSAFEKIKSMLRMRTSLHYRFKEVNIEVANESYATGSNSKDRIQNF